VADEKEEVQTRITLPMKPEVEQKVRDAAMIFGIKVHELVEKALLKYLEAVEKQAGSEFKKAMDAIRTVRSMNTDG
jgi:hypothetical protein